MVSGTYGKSRAEQQHWHSLEYTSASLQQRQRQPTEAARTRSNITTPIKKLICCLVAHYPNYDWRGTKVVWILSHHFDQVPVPVCVQWHCAHRFLSTCDVASSTTASQQQQRRCSICAYSGCIQVQCCCVGHSLFGSTKTCVTYTAACHIQENKLNTLPCSLLPSHVWRTMVSWSHPFLIHMLTIACVGTECMSSPSCRPCQKPDVLCCVLSQN